MANLLSLLVPYSFFILVIAYPSTAATIFNVIKFGAKPNGLTDCTKAFLDSWAAACASPDSIVVIRVPKGRYLVGSMSFKGECKSSNIIIKIDGTLVAPPDFHVLGKSKNWLDFNGVSGVSIIGGALDARGSALWACKASGKTCPDGATTLSFTGSSNIVIKRLPSLNSQMFHIVINGCQNVHMERVKVIAPGNSPNTDGIHVQRSRNVNILGASIKTGDDCVSIGPGTKNLWIQSIKCGPGHGISIGSLGKDLEEEGVQNVTVKKSVFIGADNGLRIKSWARPSSGFVQGVHFLDSVMNNVKYPIVIDQNYCPHNLNCPGQRSGVKITDVVYQGIRGSSATQVAIRLDCSPKNPCSGLKLQDINLTYQNQAAQWTCANAIGKTTGLVQPNSCSGSHNPDSHNNLASSALPPPLCYSSNSASPQRKIPYTSSHYDPTRNSELHTP